jgi:hypothetical protein
MKSNKTVKCSICGKEVKASGINGHLHWAHPSGATLEDSSKLKADNATLSDVVKAKDTQIAQLQDSLTKSDAAFLTVKAELAQLNDRPVSDGMVLDFINNRIDEDTWQKIGKIKQFGLATVEDSAELGDKRKLSLTSKEISEWATNLKEHDEPGSEWTEGVSAFFKFIVKNWDFPGNRADAKAILQAQGVKLKDTPQLEDELKPVNPAPATETPGTITPPPETTVTATVSDNEPDIVLQDNPLFEKAKNSPNYHYFPSVGYCLHNRIL